MGFFKGYSQDGAAQALVVTGALTAAAAFLSGGASGRGTGGRFVSRGSQSRAGSASAWTNFVADRVPELVSQGYSAKQAMQKAAEEYRK